MIYLSIMVSLNVFVNEGHDVALETQRKSRRRHVFDLGESSELISNLPIRLQRVQTSSLPLFAKQNKSSSSMTLLGSVNEFFLLFKSFFVRIELRIFTKIVLRQQNVV